MAKNKELKQGTKQREYIYAQYEQSKKKRKYLRQSEDTNNQGNPDKEHSNREAEV